jgi:hypothetical protein
VTRPHKAETLCADVAQCGLGSRRTGGMQEKQRIALLFFLMLSMKNKLVKGLDDSLLDG